VGMPGGLGEARRPRSKWAWMAKIESGTKISQRREIRNDFKKRKRKVETEEPGDLMRKKNLGIGAEERALSEKKRVQPKAFTEFASSGWKGTQGKNREKTSKRMENWGTFRELQKEKPNTERGL